MVNKKIPQTTQEILREYLNKIWIRKTIQTDWLSMELTLLGILSSDLPDTDKIAFCKETLDAFTRRGHFSLDQYPNILGI